jgi:hypothetical protein
MVTVRGEDALALADIVGRERLSATQNQDWPHRLSALTDRESAGAPSLRLTD